MSWLSKELQGKKIYQCQELNNSLVVQAFSTKSSGNMALHTGDQSELVIGRRSIFLNNIGLQLDDLVAAKQVHGTNIAVINRDLRGAGAYSYENALPGTDALVTREIDIILSVFTADCFPIFIYDTETPAIGIVHAGWRGTINRIAGLAFEKMMTEFKTDPNKCYVAFGPAIGMDCFAVDPDLAAKFQKIYPEVVSENSNAPSREYKVDLNKFNLKLIQEIGVNPEKIIISGICTGCQTKEFYSYRVEKGTIGRMMGIIALK
jgi:YfiH family protein